MARSVPIRTSRLFFPGRGTYSSRGRTALHLEVVETTRREVHVRLEPVVGVLDLSLASGTHTSLLSAGYSVSKSGVSLQASLMGDV